MRLPKRLKKAASLIGNINSGADIACDHAYLSQYLLKTNQAKYMIATDLAEAPLLIARKNLANYRDRSDIRLGYGLDPIQDNEVDTIFVCGLGAKTIVQILAEGMSRFANTTFVLQVNGDPSPLRQFLLDQPIVKEEMVYERNRYYQIIVVKEGYQLGKEKWSEATLRIGTLYETILGREYLNKRLADINKALNYIDTEDEQSEKLRKEQQHLNCLKKHL